MNKQITNLDRFITDVVTLKEGKPVDKYRSSFASGK